MKKIVAILFCLLFMFIACSCEKNSPPPTESQAAAYVGAGEMTLIEILVASNAFFVTDVFAEGHLPVDAANTVTNENGTFALVVSDKIDSYARLESMVRATYTAEIADKLLSEPAKYAEIDGKLYFNMAYDTESEYSVDWSEPEVTASIGADGKYAIEVKVKDGLSKKTVVLSAVNDNGNIRLENIYS